MRCALQTVAYNKLHFAGMKEHLCIGQTTPSPAVQIFYSAIKVLSTVSTGTACQALSGGVVLPSHQTCAEQVEPFCLPEFAGETLNIADTEKNEFNEV